MDSTYTAARQGQEWTSTEPDGVQSGARAVVLTSEPGSKWVVDVTNTSHADLWFAIDGTGTD